MVFLTTPKRLSIHGGNSVCYTITGKGADPKRDMALSEGTFSIPFRKSLKSNEIRNVGVACSSHSGTHHLYGTFPEEIIGSLATTLELDGAVLPAERPKPTPCPRNGSKGASFIVGNYALG